jgi:hypothetical protein
VGGRQDGKLVSQVLGSRLVQKSEQGVSFMGWNHAFVCVFCFSGRAKSGSPDWQMLPVNFVILTIKSLMVKPVVLDSVLLGQNSSVSLPLFSKKGVVTERGES